MDFYKDDIYSVNIRVIYVNHTNEIDKIKHETMLLNKPNIVLKDDIIQILKKNQIDNDRQYNILSILRYNINLEPEEGLVEGNNSFLSVITNIDSIVFDKSISMFHDLNELVFLFHPERVECMTITHNMNVGDFLDNN